MNLAALQENFSLPGVLSFDRNEAGLIFARIATPSCTGELYLRGAHVTRWQPVTMMNPVLYLSPRSSFVPGKAIRGGVPVIFPWFGARTGNRTSARTDGPAHGFARLEEWTLAFAALSGDDLHMTLTLGPSEQARALGYADFRLAYHVTFGEALILRLTVANDGSEPLHFEEALHTYLAVGDVEQLVITGLNDIDYLDKTDGFKRKTQEEPTLTLTGETDRPYLNTSTPIEMVDPVEERRIFVNKANSQTTVVWNPWEALSAKLPDLGEGEWRKMMCIEAANAADNAIELAPRAAHSMYATISVEPA